MKIEWSHEWGPKLAEMLPLYREEETCEFFLYHMRTKQKVVVCRPVGELSQEPELADILTGNFRPPKLWKDKFLLSKQLSWLFSYGRLSCLI